MNLLFTCILIVCMTVLALFFQVQPWWVQAPFEQI